MRGENLEVYLDDRWVFTAVMPEGGSREELDVVSVPRKHYGWDPKAARRGAVAE